MGATTWLGPRPPTRAHRVVSLVPSLTEAVFALDAGDRLVARTRFCVRPAGKVDAVPTIRGTKNPDVDAILECAPDLILANREENRREHVEALAQHAAVCVTDPASPHDIPELWRALGVALDRIHDAEVHAQRVSAQLETAPSQPLADAPRFLYLVWKGPWMAAGHDTYISRLLEAAGWANALHLEHRRYPELSTEDVARLQADAILCSSEPFDFRFPRDLEELPQAQRLAEDEYEFDDGRRAWLVDGERLSWYPVLTESGLRYGRELAARITRRS